jgi:uncharacterized circularly permuted ATP-grasp superfamily protein/uncharacterized alpha-E superfamily protein
MNDGNQKLANDGRIAGSRLIASYRPIEGVPDEMIGADGMVRPGWSDLILSFESLGIEELERRFDAADQYLRDAGVYYRMYDAGAENEREWPLAHVPLLIAEGEWQQISDGLVQRAELLEAVMSDFYGDNTLVRDGLVPPELIASNPEYLRPLAGAKPASGHFLHFCAFELGRGPNGKWWVLGDRTQAPSGAGFALENRVASNRALSDISHQMNVRRLARFFRQFRDAMFTLGGGDHSNVAILTPGPHNETYFEHAYIARYLGIMLLEGDDLTVSDGHVMVRTVSGLMPVNVLWRRLDSGFADPLELNSRSQIGTPGLAAVLRNSGANILNALGSGILETRALAAFLPAICRKLNGAELDLPSIATWWCGQETERQHVIDNFDEMMIGPAFSTASPFEDSEETVVGGALDAIAREKAMAALHRRGRDFVGQEAVRLSTTPVYVNGHLEPRPVTLRVYAARTPDGWIVMPGGFARVGFSLDTAAVTMQRGGQAADVWVVGDKPVPYDSLLLNSEREFSRASTGNLPSRAADNLIWLGRYIERSEQLVRILRAYHVRLAESGLQIPPLLEDVVAYLGEHQIDASKAIPDRLVSSIDSALNSAGQIRDRFSPDGWLALHDLSKTLHRFSGRVTPGADASHAMTVLLRKIAGFAGLVHENMYRFSGWRFLETGRRLERAAELARLIGRLIRPEAPEGAVEMLVEIGDSTMTHRRRYGVDISRLSAIDLLVLDPLNPRSVAFQLAALRTQIEMLPGGIDDGQRSEAAKHALRLETGLAIAEPGAISSEVLTRLAADVEALAELITKTYFS